MLCETSVLLNYLSLKKNIKYPESTYGILITLMAWQVFLSYELDAYKNFIR